MKTAKVVEVSHDAVNGFVLESHQTGKDLYEKTAVHLLAHAGTLTRDDSVLDKAYSQVATGLITYLYLAKDHPESN